MRVAICIRDYPTDRGSFIPQGQEIEFSSETITCGSVPVTPSQHPHFFRVEERPEGPWRPAAGGMFWWINTTLEVIPDSNSGCESDKGRIAAGNCYRTKGEAEARIPAVKRAYRGEVD